MNGRGGVGPFVYPYSYTLTKQAPTCFVDIHLNQYYSPLGCFLVPFATNTSAGSIGLVPDLENFSSAINRTLGKGRMGRGRSCRNYHITLDVIFSDLVAIHSRKHPGTDIPLPVPLHVTIGKETKVVNCYLPIAFVIGDNKSSDFLCSKIGGHSLSQPYVTLVSVSHTVCRPGKGQL